MHQIGFCGTLDIDSKGIEGILEDQRGVKVSKDFGIHRIFPMGGAVTPLHALSASRCLVYEQDVLDDYKYTGSLTSEDENPESFRILINRGAEIVAPDSLVDPDIWVDPIIDSRDEDFRKIADYLMSQGYNKVAIWANNGIGDTVEENSLEDGVLRNKLGIAYGVKKDGEIYSVYKKGLPSSFQNSAHDHVHIAPDTGFGLELMRVLSSCFSDQAYATVQEYREMLRESETSIPTIGLTLITKKTDLSMPLSYDFFFNPNKRLGNGAGLVRQLINGYSKGKEMDFSNNNFKKQELAKTHEFYSKMP